jgi:3-hydroxyisobutyrate dehydrogenase-like beta-hydroxyacid dehydrogenase
VFLCLADDQSTLDVAAHQGDARASWAQTMVVNTGTAAPNVITDLAHAYGERFVNALIIAAPQALRSGAAKFIVGGPASGRAALLPLWQAFAGALDVGEDPQTAAVIKLLHNQMLLVQLAVNAETLRAGRAAGVDDTTLATTLRESAMMPTGLRNRIDVFFDPDHAGWFSSVQGAKDVTFFLDLTKGRCAPLPVTEAARDAYRQVAQDGWETHDVTALGRVRPAFGVIGANPAGWHTRSGLDISPYWGVRRWSTGNCARVSASGDRDAFEGVADSVEVHAVEVIE